MLPTYSFLFDNVEDPCDLLEDNASMIPLAPKIGCHVHPHNYFMLDINSELDYIGEFICIKERRSIPPCQIAECPPHTGAPNDLIGLFRIFLRENDMTLEMKSIQIPVPFHNYHKCIGLHEATRTNAYIWLMLDVISDIVFISHAETIQNGYCQFGGKGIENSYFIYS